MNRMLVLSCLLLGLGLSACGSTVVVKVEPGATSSISIVDTSVPAVTVSSPGAPGSINMHVNDQLHYKVMRTVVKPSGFSTTTDVTSHSDFNFTNPPVAAMDLTGQLTAFQAGFTTLEVVYRSDHSNPTADDKVALEITVTP